MSTSQGTLNDLNVAYTEAIDPGSGVAIRIKPDGWNQVMRLVIAASTAETNTLASPTYPNQRIRFIASSVGSSGTRTITAASALNADGDLTLVFDAVDDFCILESFPVAAGSYEWRVVASEGVTGGAGLDLVVDSINIAGNITQNTAASDYILKANTAAALETTDGTTAIIAVDTRNTVKNVAAVTLTTAVTTVASESAALTNTALQVAARTTTLTGTTTTTSMLGLAARFGAQTITDASACTLTTASAIHIDAVAAAGGSLTITNSRMISTSVSDCYLTNAGVWTDTASTVTIKNDVRDASDDEIEGVMDAIKPRAWKYKPEKVGNDHDRQRFGIIAQELPECFMVPGEHEAGGLSGTVLGSFSLAAIANLHERLSKLEGRN